MRTFIAIPLSAETHLLLETLQRQLRASGADVRWTAIPSIHLTLKFLGEMDPAMLDNMAGLLRSASASQARFSLKLGGIGAFPGARNPRVVWCGIQGDIEQLKSLQQKVEEVCVQLGFPAEDREFHPHLTLGRVRGSKNLQRLIECIKIGSGLESRLAVERFNVYRSTLTPHGALYDVLEKIELQG